MDAFRARVISHVYSGNEIGKEGAKALARSLERNSSLTSLHLDFGAHFAGCTGYVMLTILQHYSLHNLLFHKHWNATAVSIRSSRPKQSAFCPQRTHTLSISFGCSVIYSYLVTVEQPSVTITEWNVA
jgi:hypothetical protein